MFTHYFLGKGNRLLTQLLRKGGGIDCYFSGKFVPERYPIENSESKAMFKGLIWFGITVEDDTLK